MVAGPHEVIAIPSWTPFSISNDADQLAIIFLSQIVRYSKSRIPQGGATVTLSSLERDAIDNLVIANKVLAHQDIVDAYGHISVRNPTNNETFFIARSIAPELVERDDIVELDMLGQPVHRNETRPLYLERFIHAGVYSARVDVNSVVHAHAEEVLPFTIMPGVPLRPVIHSGSFIGDEVPVWDIADRFGDTDLLVSTMDQANDLAGSLGANNVALMRGHGFTAAGRSIIDVVRMAIYLARNAKALSTAMCIGGNVTYLSSGEIAARNSSTYSPDSTATRRAWEYWLNKCGCGAHVSK